MLNHFFFLLIFPRPGCGARLAGPAARLELVSWEDGEENPAKETGPAVVRLRLGPGYRAYHLKETAGRTSSEGRPGSRTCCTWRGGRGPRGRRGRRGSCLYWWSRSPCPQTVSTCRRTSRVITQFITILTGHGNLPNHYTHLF